MYWATWNILYVKAILACAVSHWAILIGHGINPLVIRFHPQCLHQHLVTESFSSVLINETSFAPTRHLLLAEPLITPNSSSRAKHTDSSCLPKYLVWLVPLISFMVSSWSFAQMSAMAALLDKLSALSLPFTPAWLGYNMKVTQCSPDLSADSNCCR